MGRVNQAMRRARQSGLATEFEPIAVGAYDASVLATEPFPAESDPDAAVSEPAAPELVSPALALDETPKPAPPTRVDDEDIQEIFFNTYPEKVWGQREDVARLNNLLTKVKRHQR